MQGPMRWCARLLSTSLAGVALIMFFCSLAAGFDNKETHPRLIRASLGVFSLTDTLVDSLGLPDGIDTTLKMGAVKTSIRRWLETGSTEEDIPICRASNHFHNPLAASFESAGVTDLPARYPAFRAFCFTFENEYSTIHSNATWATRLLSPTQKGSGTGNGFDWDQAREAYLESLTLPEPAVRAEQHAEGSVSVTSYVSFLQDTAGVWWIEGF